MQDLAALAGLVLIGGELIAAGDRFAERRRLFALARDRARATGRTLVVVGDPDTGLHTRLARAYGCDDAVCVDLTGCPSCPVGVAADLSRDRVPGIADGRAVVFVACVLEYVPDPVAAWRELRRMAGSDRDVLVATVGAWSATGALYPGARWFVDRPDPNTPPTFRPVTTARKLATAALLATVATAASKRV